MSACFCLICWISDTLSQGYTDLQSLLKCLDHRGIVLVLDTRCSQARAVLGFFCRLYKLDTWHGQSVPLYSGCLESTLGAVYGLCYTRGMCGLLCSHPNLGLHSALSAEGLQAVRLTLSEASAATEALSSAALAEYPCLPEPGM